MPMQVVSNEYDLGRNRNWVALFGRPLASFAWAAPSLARRPGNGMEHTTIYTLGDEDSTHGK
jgi:hypothetical protein